MRHGYVHRIVQELGRLLKYPSTSASAKPVLKRVRQYLNNHLAHLQYRQFKKQGFPIGSGMVESACKWLIEQRFKGTGMRWSEAGFNPLLHLRLAGYVLIAVCGNCWLPQRRGAAMTNEPQGWQLGWLKAFEVRLNY